MKLELKYLICLEEALTFQCFLWSTELLQVCMKSLQYTAYVAIFKAQYLKSFSMFIFI